MPNISSMRDSNFLKRSDVGAGALFTIKDIHQENVAKQGAPEELKWCMSFEEAEKPVVLNSTNMQICAKVFQSDETDDWIGEKIVLYDDPNISFGGRIVGGIRMRAPRNQPQQRPHQPQAPRRPNLPAAQPEQPYQGEAGGGPVPGEEEPDVPFNSIPRSIMQARILGFAGNKLR